MNKLSRHIKALLMKHNCVIVPHLGGFVAQYMPAAYDESEACFNPPYRNVAFNAMLGNNDGLLVERYAKFEGLSFTDAARLLESQVAELKDSIAEKGEVELIGIGTLSSNGEGGYQFAPRQGGLMTPSLYAMETIILSSTDSVVKAEEVFTNPTEIVAKPAEEKPLEIKCVTPTHTQELVENIVKPALATSEETAMPLAGEEDITRNKKKHAIHLPRIHRAVINYAAVAVITVMFYFLVAPSSHVTPDFSSLASVVPSTLTEKMQEKTEGVAGIKAVKAETKKSENATNIAESTHNSPEVKPTETAGTPVVTPTKAEENKPASVEYVIVMASAVQRSYAEDYVARLKAEGLVSARVTESSTMRRVVIGHFSSEDEARIYLRHLNDDERFASCWVMRIY